MSYANFQTQKEGKRSEEEEEERGKVNKLFLFFPFDLRVALLELATKS